MNRRVTPPPWTPPSLRESERDCSQGDLAVSAENEVTTGR